MDSQIKFIFLVKIWMEYEEDMFKDDGELVDTVFDVREFVLYIDQDKVS